MNRLKKILDRKSFSKEDIITMLSLTSDHDIDLICKKANAVLLDHIGSGIYLRGLIEFSNICSCDCYYCGLRKSNKDFERYILKKNDIIAIAINAAKKGFASIVLQSGEIQNEKFTEFVADCVNKIKQITKSDSLPDGLGITLCCGEQSNDVYAKWFDAGAHRYLLRIESSDRKLFEKFHPPGQSYRSRYECLKSLKSIGYQTGTGVIIGLPGQTVDHLTEDIIFFRDMDIDMLGMGPYIHHNNTPLSDYKALWEKNRNDTFLMSMKMIAVSRIVLKDVNIAATTALDAIEVNGRELGVSFGANVLMPLLTPENHRAGYKLYEGKTIIDNIAEDTATFAQKMHEKFERIVIFDKWGDAPHYFNNKIGR